MVTVLPPPGETAPGPGVLTGPHQEQTRKVMMLSP
jgi:hypothetical protein